MWKTPRYNFDEALQRLRFPCESPVGGALLRVKAYESDEPGLEARPTRKMHDRKGHRATRCRRVTETSEFLPKGNNHGYHYNLLQPLNKSYLHNAIVDGATPLRKWDSLQNQSSIIQWRTTITHLSTMVGPVTGGTNKTK